MDDISQFEWAVFFIWLAASLAFGIGMKVIFEVRERRSPVGRFVGRRHFGGV